MSHFPDGVITGTHLVGSVPLASAEDVFRSASEALGQHLCRIPDGETGERTGWVWFQLPLLTQHPSLEESTVSSVEELGDKYRKHPTFRVRDDVDLGELVFGRLHYADCALESYQVFSRLKREGVLPGAIRFQVSLPSPLGPLVPFIEIADIPKVLPAYQAALLRELDEICQKIPTSELAIQWDVASEMALLEGAMPSPFDDLQAAVVAELAELANAIPDGVEFGYHLCYGDFGHKHLVEPRDTSTMVNLMNVLLPKLKRSPNWLHMPVPRDRSDDAYFKALADLAIADDTELYLGLVHQTDGLPGALDRLAAARRHRTRFGIGTECGFGRRDPATIPSLFELHRELLELK